ncbi:hypothetical protein QH639_14785 [Lysinibacillus sp. 1 U-2021]|uniref:hypothetical protein n=1 Tax=Lysinibacillus sp. 1 U-2021 TaxID=3039426 RepID=UPI00247FA5FC|nr:hypothetical protein [Lysinibacillus sp. 1 U-2021]WGT37111.1 hypothetical protein QH639_14785 [Lysinibacillus sp. 1 U-2021]
MPKYEVDLDVTFINGKEKSKHSFELEELEISRATKLWITNKSAKESEFIETVKLNFDIDKNTNTTTYYEFSTSIPTTIITSFIYYVERIDSEGDTVVFNSHDL